MDSSQWHVSAQAIKNSKKPYAHFDFRTDISQCWDYISNPDNIAHHGFYPFIHYEQMQIKFSDEKGKKEKARDICYSAHIDRCIYQYYAHLLNEKYNAQVQKDGISNVAVAYRTDLHKSNIHFSHEAFSFIRQHTPCYVMIGDFTGFFDNLDHLYLKSQLCNLLNVSKLPTDYYAVFKNITRYSTWDLTDLLALNELTDTRNDRCELNKKMKVLSSKLFNDNKSHINKNSNAYGIPQGSAISALLANVYMLDCDRQLNELVKALNGFYMRYSDDFMIVLPNLDNENFLKSYSGIIKIIKSVPRLYLQPDKTQMFYYSGDSLINCGSSFDKQANCKSKFINFLGFTFDGSQVSIRDKTLSKYYYRMYRKAKTIADNDGYTSSGKHISCQNIYAKYSYKGSANPPGNFISYVQRAQKEYGDSEAIQRGTKHHMQKIKRAIHPK